ncbi:MAG: S41 family peptidase [Phycisphaerales bacterium]|nr:S41 family peptidase [Phycisphaerales bacterium]
MERAEPPAPATGGPAGAGLPDTAAAACAEGFLAVVNAGTGEVSRAFEGKWASKARLAKASLEERAGRAGELKGEFAPAKILRVVSSSEGSIVLAVEVKGGREAQVEFEMSSVEPGKLDAVLITSGDAVESHPLTDDERIEVVRGAAKVLTSYYVYPEVAEKMAESVIAKLDAGGYDGVKDEAALARKLTEDFRAVSRDKHLRVALSPESEGRHAPVGLPPAEEMRRENYAFRKVEVLPGNIGYLRFDLFMENPEAKRAASDALGFLRNCDAVIFDLRANGGGSPEMIRYITSYFYEKPTHLNDMVDREGKVVEEFWTLEEVPGERFAADVPVYILTSGRTFSGAEEFTYNLRNLKRATVVGETTGGGAHPVRPERVNERFIVGVPYMRACNPISKTNWEGTGVEPHIAVPADKALDRAVEEARGALEARRAAAKNPKS